jgi:hypothetical protein
MRRIDRRQESGKHWWYLSFPGEIQQGVLFYHEDLFVWLFLVRVSPRVLSCSDIMYSSRSSCCLDVIKMDIKTQKQIACALHCGQSHQNCTKSLLLLSGAYCSRIPRRPPFQFAEYIINFLLGFLWTGIKFYSVFVSIWNFILP